MEAGVSMLSYRKRAIAALAVACAMMLTIAPQATSAQASQTSIPGIQVQLTSVARTPTGPILVKWTYHNTGSQSQTVSDAGCYLEVNGKKFPATVTSVGKGVVVPAQGTVSAWGVVAGLDPSTTSVTVHLNGAQPFKNTSVGGS
jgi:hypothetical protein